MTGTTIAEIRWRALDREGHDSCRLVRQDGGWMLIGHARFREAEGASALDYVVRCGPEWETLGAHVTGLWRDGRVAINLAREGDVWMLSGQRQPGLDGARDIDFGFTPATNLMPLRRLPEIGGIDATAAWLRDPGSVPVRLDQRYVRGRGGLVHYVARQTGFETDLLVASSGFVTRYPGLWEAERAG